MELLRKLMGRLQEEATGQGNDLPGEPPAGTPPVDKWAELLSDDDGVVGGDTTGEVEPEQQTGQPPKPDEQPTSTEPQPDVPAESQEQQQATEVQQPAQPAQTPITPEQAAAIRAQFEAELERKYVITDEAEITALQTEPEKVLPKMAARLETSILESVSQHIFSMLPQMMHQYSQATERETKARNEFFDAWPELKGHDAEVLQLGVMFRQVNPNASPQDFIQRVGKMALDALGLEKRGVQSQPPEQLPAQPPQAYRPAAAGHVATPPARANKWESLMNDDE